MPVQAPGAVAGHCEAQAVAAAKAALQLSPVPADCCRAQLALAKAYLALHYIQAGPNSSEAAWSGAADVASTAAPTANAGAASSGAMAEAAGFAAEMASVTEVRSWQGLTMW